MRVVVSAVFIVGSGIRSVAVERDRRGLSSGEGDREGGILYVVVYDFLEFDCFHK